MTSYKRVQAQLVLSALRRLRALNLTAYMGLAFFERPVWCYKLQVTSYKLQATSYKLQVHGPRFLRTTRLVLRAELRRPTSYEL